ncbi:isocitrate dehydrogenase [NAD] subunit gamma, mitochondrial-like isoform X2 [Mercenaria mercenaria]|uniref:isocitrate dehydrogenase [NAD] subunit gamma, mitochondrial-like isoform X2 n=1 Tax=Mercenaria mercenaria TaxID=6596 RepID=UPI00234F053B|nr:isocitrate dehydrogenase [NAD] subunit gamma, mitochondrial-like isoform X2 [Mercenaria mercenaria]
MAASIRRSIQLQKLLKNLRVLPQATPSQRTNVTASASSVEKFSKYGGRNTVTVLTGDGVGPELLKHVQEIFRYAGAPVVFEEVNINVETTDEEFLNQALLSVGRNGVALKGNIATNHESTVPSMNVKLRTDLKLFGSIVRCKSMPGVPTRHAGIDMVLIRENTEGEYSNLEHENVQGVIESLKIITEAKSTNIARYAFEYAKKHGRKKVTAVHKANIMKLGDGLFLNCCRNVSKDYPEIEFNDMIIDNASMQMVSRPQQFDVLVMPNLYGNILSNIATGLVGGSGVVGGMNIGEDYAVFEMGTRNTGLSLKGKNIANPTGLLLASCDMLDYLGHYRHATLIRESVLNVLNEKKVHTPDLGGQATTTDVVQAIIQELKPKTKAWLV